MAIITIASRIELLVEILVELSMVLLKAVRCLLHGVIISVVDQKENGPLELLVA